MKIRSIKKLLIANRGEIACRIMRTCESMGIKTVAVYSEADRNALHIESADEAVFIGPPEARLSYLDGAKIIDAAKRTHADAIHPGYGFLSENADFAQAVIDTGLIWVGPHPKAIRDMGSKINARRLAAKLGIPVVPGYDGDAQTPKKLVAEANKIGYPIMIKASAGGGGKGIRIVHEESEFARALDLAKKESKAAFGDDKVILERYIAEPRHVEVQIMGDKHGNVVHFFTRDCSIQRRHQKLVEEAPAPNLPDTVRENLHECAVKLAKAIDYDNAGTVEFLYDGKEENFYFLEVNTRLQVEHPVTEEITGEDLVELQIDSASGTSLKKGQEEITSERCAIEVRVNAEDPQNDFIPQTGSVIEFAKSSSYFIRVDSGIKKDSHVPPYYDSLLAKVIADGDTREETVERLLIGLRDTQVYGIATNLDYLRDVIADVAFRNADISTHFLERHMAGWKPEEECWFSILAVTAAALLEQLLTVGKYDRSDRPWRTLAGWRLWRNARYAGWNRLVFEENARRFEILLLGSNGEYKIRYLDRDATVRLHRGHRWILSGFIEEISAEIDGVRSKFTIVVDEEGDRIHVNGGRYQHGFRVVPRSEQYVSKAHQHTHAASNLVAPFPGLVTEVAVKAGDAVAAGDTLVVMEAMKMIQHLAAQAAGVVKAVRCRANQSVDMGRVLVEFEADGK